MAAAVAMPRMGVTMEAGTVLRWLKRVGEPVALGEPLMEIQTDKVNLEVTSDVDGTLLAIVVPEGQEVPVGTTLAWVGAPAEAVPAPPGRPRASPSARARARERGVDLRQVTGTGPGGRIQARDVLAAAQAPAPASAPQAPAPAPAPQAPAPAPVAAAAAGDRDLPVAGVRRVIAERLARSFHSSVPVLLTTEVTMDRCADLLARIGPDLAGQAGGKAGYLPLVIRAVAAALRAHPSLNAHWLGDRIRRFAEVHVGVAVALDDGLVVPVLRRADRLGLGETAAQVQILAERARRGQLAPTDLEGGTFTVSNLGRYDVGFFMPVLNPPEVGILGVGRAGPRAVARDGQVTVLPVLPLSLVFDHRAVDGAPAAAFLAAVKGYLEEPYRLLL